MHIAKNLFENFGDAIPLSMYRRMLKRQVIGAYYHIVSDEDLPHVKHLHSYKSPELFERDLVFLKNHFAIISYPQLIDHYANGSPLPQKSLFLSIDDGYEEGFSTIRPILLQHRVPCTYFVSTGLVDNKQLYYRNSVSICIDTMRRLDYKSQLRAIHEINARVGRSIDNASNFEIWMTNLTGRDEWIINEVANILGVNLVEYLNSTRPYVTSEQIATLARDGFTIGAHGRKHHRLELLDDQSVREEIVGSCSDIRGLTEQDSIPFAFPDSGRGLDRVFLATLVSEFPFVGLMLDSHGVQKDVPNVLHRICLDSHDAPVHRHSNAPQQFRSAYKDQAFKNLTGLRRAIIGYNAQ